MLLRNFFFAIFSLLISVGLSAQSHVKWTFTAKDAGNCQVDLVFTGTIDEGWCTYSQFIGIEDGPTPISLTFQQTPGFKLVGEAKESGDITKEYDKMFQTTITKFKHKAVLTQRVTVSDPTKPVTGYLSFVACNDMMCTAPRDVDFSFKIPALKGCKPKAKNH